MEQTPAEQDETPAPAAEIPVASLLTHALQSLVHSVAPGLQPPDGETKVLTGLSEVIAEMMNELKNLDFAEPETDAQKLFITTQGVVLRARIATMRRIRRSFEDALYEVDTSGDDSEDAHSYSPDDDEEDED